MTLKNKCKQRKQKLENIGLWNKNKRMRIFIGLVNADQSKQRHPSMELSGKFPFDVI